MNSRKGFFRYVIDLVFPNRCPFCDELITWEKLSCDKCYSEIMWADENVCKRCGKDNCICSEDIFYDRCYPVAYYEGVVKKAVVALKSKNGLNFADIIADVASYKMNSDGITDDIDYIVPVPMSRRKLNVRTYNQAMEIAKSLKRLINKKICNNVLYKHYQDFSQHELNSDERKENVKGLFYLNNNVSLKDKNILLCDDVMTTGSTVNECSRLLKSAGAKSVIVVVGATTSLTL